MDIPDANALELSEAVFADEVKKIYVYRSWSGRRSQEVEIHLSTRVGIRGVHSVSADTDWAHNKPREDATEAEQRSYDMLQRLSVLEGVEEVRADGYKIKVEFGQIFEIDDLLPNVLTVIINCLHYQRVLWSIWVDHARLWRGKVRTEPGFILEIPGVDIAAEPGNAPEPELEPQDWEQLTITQGTCSHRVWAKLEPDVREMLFDPNLPTGVVSGLDRPSRHDPDDTIEQSIDKTVGY